MFYVECVDDFLERLGLERGCTYPVYAVNFNVGFGRPTFLLFLENAGGWTQAEAEWFVPASEATPTRRTLEMLTSNRR